MKSTCGTHETVNHLSRGIVTAQVIEQYHLPNLVRRGRRAGTAEHPCIGATSSTSGLGSESGQLYVKRD
jgi:hypothetical protein